MDSIAFDYCKSELEDYLTTRIYVNGIDLIVLITSIESKQLHPQESFALSGAYEGISPFIAFHLYDHFHKKTMNEYIYNDSRFTLYEYINSGVPGDHTLTCKIDITKNSVMWYDFKSFSRIHPRGFDYNDLTFTFDRSAYTKAVEILKANKLNPLYA